jgi:hypothetical protein
MMEVNTEDFIIEIEKHPSIRNTECEEYSNKLEKMKAWGAMISKFSPDFGDKSSSEKKTIGESSFRRSSYSV